GAGGQVARADPHGARHALAALWRAGWRRRLTTRARLHQRRAIDVGLLQVGPELAVAVREDERVDRLLFRLVVDDQLEPLGQQRPNHQLQRIRSLSGNGCRPDAAARRVDRLLHGRVDLGDDIEVIRVEPARAAGDLEVLKLIRLADQHPQRDIGGREAAWLVAEHDAAVAGVVRLDRRHLEGGRGAARLRLRAARADANRRRNRDSECRKGNGGAHDPAERSRLRCRVHVHGASHSTAGYSPRSARIGSVREACRAGIAVAAQVSSTTTAVAVTSTSGSDARTPNTRLDTARPPAYAAATPIATPMAMSHWPRRIISQNISPGVAPSARRVAISPRRCEAA